MRKHLFLILLIVASISSMAVLISSPTDASHNDYDSYSYGCYGEYAYYNPYCWQDQRYRYGYIPGSQTTDAYMLAKYGNDTSDYTCYDQALRVEIPYTDTAQFVRCVDAYYYTEINSDKPYMDLAFYIVNYYDINRFRTGSYYGNYYR